MKISDAVVGALKSVARVVPEVSVEMTHGDFTGSALLVSSNDIGSEVATADGPTEKCRAFVRRSEFPALTRGCLVRLGSSARLVTSAVVDAVGASLKLGLSDEMSNLVVKYTGTRRVDGELRRIDVGLEALGVSRGTLDTFGDAIAPIHTEEWYVVIARDTWSEVSAPEEGDALEFYADRLHRMKVADVADKDGYWILTCRRRV